MRRRRGNLVLGSAVVELLIPHRPPFLLVDHVRDFEMGPPASVRAGRHLSPGEPVLEGHFPGFPIWPGVYTLEGLGQTGVLLMALVELTEGARREGREPEEVLEGLRNLDRGYRLHPGYREGDAEAFRDRLPTRDTLSLGAAVDMKLLRPVFPGSRLDYEVALEQRVGDAVRFRAEAFVDDEAVARGSITGSLSPRPLPPRF